MIKVTRAVRPEKLTDEVQRLLTEEFKKDHEKAVWNKAYIRDALLEESRHKCVYCECLIGKGHKEMHVDHFHYKDRYADEVVSWDNLNPSCPRCNKRKHTHDTYRDPIVNPFEQDPKDYFCIRNYRLYCKNKDVETVARTTIDVLGLNDTDEVVNCRFEIGNALIEKIEELCMRAEENEDILSTSVPMKNRVLRGCRNILKLGTRDAEYAAFMSTIIMENPYYQRLKALLQRKNLWDQTLRELDAEVSTLKMQTGPD